MILFFSAGESYVCASIEPYKKLEYTKNVNPNWSVGARTAAFVRDPSSLGSAKAGFPETKESKDDSEGKKSDEDKTTTEDLKSRVKSLEEVVKKKLSGSESDSLVTLLSGR